MTSPRSLASISFPLPHIWQHLLKPFEERHVDRFLHFIFLNAVARFRVQAFVSLVLLDPCDDLLSPLRPLCSK